ncbi:hypothetical protein SPRG_09751 [Saprolegnia parasitica CBS 223.65]|uniref:Phosphodiesterase n=1 Tax=Saprolegnia parasitica (strain CBS 223.65) TaxID=695850 RepID=A0A067CEN3_SAPPC|nr:hypothetical protein SPRG_09751 [Saprolegnia parasitica CBS 223.65]KDO25021.1 hypothetical protein SPRG_09751 [Saprolegnia parasitica CBS 223.65]|eukprot:XP_012204290.1 hypothetical protein SPRG_09751 [Saprolegnia parasitica CBS 223.65]
MATSMHSGKVTPRNEPSGFDTVDLGLPPSTRQSTDATGSGTLPAPPALTSLLMAPFTWLRASSSKTLSGRVAPDRLSSRKSIASQHSSQLMRWDFDAGLETNHLRQMDNLQTIFGIVGAYAALDVSFESLNLFMNDVKLGYVEAPDLPFHRYYHNFTHAMDVTQTLFAMLHFIEPLDPILGPVEKAITLIAALGHDIHHPGVTNHYIVVAKHAYALEYGDGSASALATTSVKVWGVLERMHAAETRRLVTKHRLLGQFRPTTQVQLEKLLMACILNTDMAQHDGLLKHMQSLVTVRHNPLSADDTRVLCSFFLHCADLSNAAKPWKTAERWASLITQEFFEQGQAEKRRGMPVSPNCDATTTMVPELQIKFINFAVLPCFTILQALFPLASETVTHALTNIQYWEAKRDDELTLEQRYIWAKRLCYHPAYLVSLALISIYLVIEPSVREMATSIDGDAALNAFLLCLLVIVLADMSLTALADHLYCGSFFSFLDFATAISIVLEVCSYAPHATSSSVFLYVLPELLQPRIVRVARVLRAVHAVPLLLFRLFAHAPPSTPSVAASETSSDVDDDRSTPMAFSRRDIARLFTRLASRTSDVVRPAAIERLVAEAYNGIDVPPHAARNVLAYFTPTHATKSSFAEFANARSAPRISISRASFARGIRHMELKHDGAPDLFMDAAPRPAAERMVGRELSDIVIKRILVLVFLVLIVVPPLIWEAEAPNDVYSYSLESLHASALLASSPPHHDAALRADLALFVSHLTPLFLQLHNVSAATIAASTNGVLASTDAALLAQYRYDQLESVQVFGCDPSRLVTTLSTRTASPGECLSTALFDVTASRVQSAQWAALSTLLCFVCVMMSVLYLDYETYTTVIHPIESMLHVVQRLAINPLRSIPCLAGEASNEILLLQNTLAKIASLIQIGFGEAGAEILSGNMLEGDLNPMAEGKKVYAIFGFCSIRDFADATEKLKEEIMTFTNLIGDVVHRHVHALNGHANKNIGQAFLLVWKVPSTSIEYALVNGNQTPQHMSPKKNSLLTVMESDNMRQRGKLTIADKALIAFLKVQLEMHEAAALKPYAHVLPKAHPMGFGLHVGWAIEGAIGSRYKIDASYLSPDVNMSSRLEGATKQFGVTLLVSHTFHKLLSAPVQAMCRLIDCVTVKGSEKPLSLYTFDIYDDLGAHAKNALGCIDDLRKLQMRMPIEFRIAFDSGVAKYLEGNWPEATLQIEHALCFAPTDGPSKSLLRVMAEHQGQAPSAWQGYRALTEK